MNGPLLALVWLLQPTAAQGAFGAARPPECRLVDGVRSANAWERAKQPNLRRYCDLLASGTAKLASGGKLASEVPHIADVADELLPGRAAPRVLKGRALLRLDDAGGALAELAEAKRRDERALDDPVALLAWARANGRIGHRAEAVRAYRAALPRTSGLTPSERSSASLEAALAVMSEGPAGVDDAVAMLRQSAKDAQGAMQLTAVSALGLALDRAGQRDEARAVLVGRTRADLDAILSEPRVVEALADAGAPHERDALLALALEADGAQVAAKDAWRAYLDGSGGKGEWADHAREHLGRAPPRSAPVRPAPPPGERRP